MVATGIYRGICIDARDPQGLGRVRVSVPQVLGPASSGWAFPAWSVHDLSIWPEDRMPKPGQGVWVSFESADRMTWLAVFGPQEFSEQRYDSINSPVTGLPVAYETSLDWDLPVLPPDIAVPIAGSLFSPSGVPQPEPYVVLAKHPPAADAPDPTSGSWETIATVPVTADGSWSIDYTRPSGEDDWWYRATYDGVEPFWPATAGPQRVAQPPDTGNITWDAQPSDFQWQRTAEVSGTLTKGNGDPIGLTEVRLYQKVTDTWVSVATATTTPGGNWTARWFWPVPLTDGFDMRALFLGSDEYDFDMTPTIAVPPVSVPVNITMVAPSLPKYGEVGRFTGTVGTDEYGVPEEVRVLIFQVMELAAPSVMRAQAVGEWVDTALIQASPDGLWQLDYTFVEPYADYRVKFYADHVYGDAVSNSKDILLELSTTTTAPTMSTALYQGSGFSVSGTVRDIDGGVATSGQCALMYRYTSETDDDWRESTAPRAAVSAGGQYSLSHPPLDFLGSAMWRVDYLGSGHLLPSSSIAVTKNVGLNAVTALTKGAVTHSSATVSWNAVPGATGYQIWRNTGDWGIHTPGELTYTFGSLAAYTDYTFEIQATATDIDGNTLLGAKSPQAKCNTGRVEKRKTGSFTRDQPKTASGTWRDPDGWSYNGNDIVQGYYSNANYRAYSVMTYSGANFQSWVTSTYGSDVLANLSFTKTQVYMHRNSTSYTGSGPVVSIWWYVTSAIAHQGGRPTLAGGAYSSGLALGTAGWKTIPYAHWGKHVLLNETTSAGVTNSFALYRNNSTEYSKYYGTTASACLMRVDCSWNFVTQSYVAPKWY